MAVMKSYVYWPPGDIVAIIGTVYLVCVIFREHHTTAYKRVKVNYKALLDRPTSSVLARICNFLK